MAADSEATIARREGEDGFGFLRRVARRLPQRPGVYRMLGADGKVLYVGKARILRNRVGSYAQAPRLTARIMRMVEATRALEIVTTHTETEALLLEANLIKRLKPHYNVILRDDKSFPYILIRDDHPYPRITKYRGAKTVKGDYFGPFASAGSVNRTLAALARVFPLRSCSDGDFATRTRPCLQYQIKRCTAPCVGRIDEAGYAALVGEARDFLAGRNTDLQQRLGARMEEAAAEMNYEAAAMYRDRLRALAHVTAHQDINVASLGEADVIAAWAENGQTCIQVFFFRAGQNFGNRPYYPAHAGEVPMSEVLAAFIGQFYEERPAPKQVLVSHDVENAAWLAEALGVRAGHKVQVTVPQRGLKRQLVERAVQNAREALGQRLAETAAQRGLLERVAEAFGLPETPQRIEVYDNSHIQGAASVGGMIVAGPEGFRKNAYRKFNIKQEDLAPGDDFGMLREVLTRRFGRLLKEAGPRQRPDPEAAGHDETADAGENTDAGGEMVGAAEPDWPDLLLIDGGKGQLSSAKTVMAELQLDDLPLVAISKGPEREAGREQFHLADGRTIMLEPRDPLLYFLQRLRDEAHRFAIGAHRARRAKGNLRSPIDEIPGIGPKRKRALMLHFGSGRDIAKAGLADLEAVEGISRTVAQRIYDHFHGS
ncbi:excinuclease ABC subunit UvrC [Marinibaculum pumilum]|uniref:UvrABC system protein C n=1 Tax=Marinibaculum pumilum TaxID=1766165 RepID=A0ABV7L4V2_9PROT